MQASGHISSTGFRILCGCFFLSAMLVPDLRAKDVARALLGLPGHAVPLDFAPSSPADFMRAKVQAVGSTSVHHAMLLTDWDKMDEVCLQLWTNEETARLTIGQKIQIQLDLYPYDAEVAFVGQITERSTSEPEDGGRVDTFVLKLTSAGLPDTV